jgi:hypothetical protein
LEPFKETMMRHVCGIVIAALLWSPTLAASTQSTDTGGNESLGGKLLEDLGPAPAPSQMPRTEGLTPRNSQSASTPPAASSMLPLARVQQGMQNAQALLAQPGANTHSGTIKLAGSVQQDVIAQLDKLIADLSKQCQGRCQGGQCDKPPSSSEKAKPKPGKAGTAAGRGKAPAKDSSDRLDRASAQPVEKGDVNEMVKELWGHLPERTRQQMLQSFSDEFLPKYQLEIEQYYRRLSEEKDQTPPK